MQAIAQKQAAEHKTRWTSSDLEYLPDNNNRYEIIDGELYVSKQPHWHHQHTCSKICLELELWSRTTGLGEASMNPGVIFSESDDVVPDVVWISHGRLELLLDQAGHLAGAPELAIEVLLPGGQNERRDRQAKLKLYETQGVREYWIVDWRVKQVEIYRRDQGALRQTATLLADDELTSPLLPGFSCPVARFFG